MQLHSELAILEDSKMQTVEVWLLQSFKRDWEHVRTCDGWWLRIDLDMLCMASLEIAKVKNTSLDLFPGRAGLPYEKVWSGPEILPAELELNSLRTAPTFASVHTFCASRKVWFYNALGLVLM